jgi:hypothetical protein
MEKLRTSDYRGYHWPEEDEDSYPLYVIPLQTIVCYGSSFSQPIGHESQIQVQLSYKWSEYTRWWHFQ